MHRNLPIVFFTLLGMFFSRPGIAQTVENTPISQPPVFGTEPVKPAKGFTRLQHIQANTDQQKPEKVIVTYTEKFRPIENDQGPATDNKENTAGKDDPRMETARQGSTLQTDISTERIYPDLQVTATPENPQTQVFLGNERLPIPVAEKTGTPTPAEKISAPDTNSTSTIGKVSFLKQYVSELKTQIEKNKNNANYPLAEKQQELLQLENLLKGE